MTITIKRAYDKPSPNDGYRVLVDRLWPRGVSREELAINEWCRDIAPSTELRKWFNHDPARFAEFTARYQDELAKSDAPQQLLVRTKGHGKLTLIYGTKDPKINHAAVLREYCHGLPHWK